MNILPFSKFTIHGTSMLPTLKPGQSVLTFNWLSKFDISDIIVAKVGDKLLIKRITQLKSTEVFLEGDNKNQSTDSRKFGWVNRSQIIGKIVLF